MSRHAKHTRPFTVVLRGGYVFARFFVVKTMVKLIRVAYKLIVTFLLKLSSQWVKYVLGCVYINLPIGEMKKKIAKMSEFIHNLARGRMATACFLPNVVCLGRGKLPKRKVRPSSNVDLFMYHT